MKLPGVASVAAFAGGILLGLLELIPPRPALHPFPAIVGVIALLLLPAAFVLAWRDYLWSAASVSLLSWIA